MDDRRRNPDFNHILAARDMAACALRVAFLVGGVAGWLFIWHIFTGG